MATEGNSGMAIAQPSRKRKKRKKKNHKKGHAPAAQPTPPAPPGKYKHTLGWDDSAGDGVVREIFEWVDSPPTDTPPPRPLPQAQNPAAPAAAQPWSSYPYNGPFGRVQAKRLLDRAGFGPGPGQALTLSQLGMNGAVDFLISAAGSGLSGPEPVDDDGQPLDPTQAYGHDHLWWLDRMVRAVNPLPERMALIFHDWFATSNAGVDDSQAMMNQSDLFRNGGLGSFLTLTLNVTQDPAMLVWLNGNENRKNGLNENYARELMELFTLGADRHVDLGTDAYTENDIRETARALTGWRNDYNGTQGNYNFRFDPNRHDNNSKTIFGRPGNWNWDQVPQLCVENTAHKSFFVKKLWSYFIPQPPHPTTQAALESLYTSNNYAIKPVVEAILKHPDFYEGPPIVKPPVVFTASLLRAIGRYIDTDDWTWLCDLAGQQLFWPPNVSGWDDTRWLDTSRMRARWYIVNYALANNSFDPWSGPDYSATETATQALDNALATWDYPPLRSAQQNELLHFSQHSWDDPLDPSSGSASWQQSPYRAIRRNALQQLIGVSPDLLLA
jgi:hypothetical protein